MGIINKNLEITRRRRNERERRAEIIKRRMYDRVAGNRDENRNMNPIAIEGFRRLKL